MSAAATTTATRSKISNDQRSRPIGADVAGDGRLAGGVATSQAAEEASDAAASAVRKVLEEVNEFDVAAADTEAGAAGDSAARLRPVLATPSSALR